MSDHGARGARAAPAPLALLLAATALWGCWFIFRTSFASAGGRVFCLFDDAMISMTYARNLVEGHGLSWARQGAPVEGFTHPLWTLAMVPANALPIPRPWRSLAVQLASLALLLAHVALVHRLVRRHFSYPRAVHALPATLSTAFYYPLDYWACMGMETALQALVLSAAVYLTLDALRLGRERPFAFGALAAGAYLLRMDMLLPLLALAACAFLCQPAQPVSERDSETARRRRRRWSLAALLPAAAIAGYGLFRWLYFGDLLPNTYYLKLSGIPLVVRLLRGSATLADSFGALGLLLPALAVGAFAVASDAEERRRLAPPAVAFLVACAYDVYVGGDAWEGMGVHANRFVAFAMPQLFVIANGLLNRCLDRLAARAPGVPVRLALAAAAAAVFFSANGLWPGADARDAWQSFLISRRPPAVVSHEIVYGQLRELQRIAAPGAVVAVTWAGIPAYFSDFRMVDFLGYNDRAIARGPLAVHLDEDDPQIYWPGHARWNVDHVLRRHAPDAFLQTWGMSPADERRVLRANGYRRRDGFWVRLGSPFIRWSAAESGSARAPA